MSRYGIRALSQFLLPALFDKPPPEEIDFKDKELDSYEIKVSTIEPQIYDVTSVN